MIWKLLLAVGLGISVGEKAIACQSPPQPTSIQSSEQTASDQPIMLPVPTQILLPLREPSPFDLRPEDLKRFPPGIMDLYLPPEDQERLMNRSDR